jgi:hypothetical protein
MSYIEWFQSITPNWLRTGYGEGYTDLLGTLLDSIAQQAEDAVTTRLVQSQTIDALDQISNDRQLPKHPNISNDTFRNYALNTFLQWQKAGTIEGIPYCLESLGFSGITIGEGTDPTYAVPYSLEWFQFVVLIDAFPSGVFITSAPLYADPTTDLYGTSIVYGVITEIGKTITRQAVQRFKSAHSQCVLIGFKDPVLLDYVFIQGEI